LPTAKERVRLMLSLVPYVVNHPGVEVAELSRLFEVSDRELLRDLELLYMTGTPPYGPGDLIDVDVEDGRVWIRLADHLRRPQTLTLPEAISLYLRGRALEGTPGFPDAPALHSALAKIEGALGEDTLRELASRVEWMESPEAGALLDAVRRAADVHERLAIVYFAHSTDEVTSRRIDPERVFAALGHWYVVAWDEAAGGERMFRVDRIREATPTGEHFEPRGLQGGDRPLYTRSDADIVVRLRLASGVRWLTEYYESTVVEEREDGVEVLLPTRSLAWLTKLLVGLGSEVTILDPPELRAEVTSLATRILEAY
jgi:predicted DNA-binding transcriptional regulator YafY